MTLCQSIVELASTQCPSLLSEAVALGEKFKELFLLFSKCHNIYDNNYVTDEDIKQLGMSHTLINIHYTVFYF